MAGTGNGVKSVLGSLSMSRVPATTNPMFLFAVVVGMLILFVALATATGRLLPLSIVVTGGCILSVVMFKKPVMLLYFVPLLLSLEYRFKSGFISFTVAEISTILVWIVAILQIWTRERVYIKKNEIFFISFIVATALPSVLLANDTSHALSVYRDFTIPLVFFVGFMLLDLTREQVIKLAKLFVVIATISALVGIIQYKTGSYLWFQDPDDVLWQNYKINYIRTSIIGQWLGVKDTLAVGLYSMTNNFASYLVIPLVLAFAFATTASLRSTERLLWSVAFISLFVGLVFTCSRGSLLTFLVAWILYMGLLKKPRVSKLYVMITAGVGILLAGAVLWSGVFSWDQLGTFLARTKMIQEGLAFVRDYPLALVTGGLTEEYLADYLEIQLVHNNLLYAIIQFGLLATLGWFGLVVVKLREIFGAVSSYDREVKVLELALFVGLATTVFLYGQTTSLIDQVQVSLWFFFWVGIGSHLYRLRKAALLSHSRIVSALQV